MTTTNPHAAAFAAAAYEARIDDAQGTHAMIRSYLLALVDPMHPDLDYLRAEPEAAVETLMWIEETSQEALRALSARLTAAEACRDGWKNTAQLNADVVEKLAARVRDLAAERDRLREAVAGLLAAWPNFDGMAHRQGERCISGWDQYLAVGDAVKALKTVRP